MKSTLNRVLLGGALVAAAAGISWAGPSQDLMNSITRTRVQAGQATTNKPVNLGAKHECAGCQSRTATRNVTAGQSTVAVPITQPAAGCCKK
jgi:hypothetical protein